jgi:hypothetical protein
MYGVECDFLLTEKMNVDKVLMDFSHLKLSEKNSKKVYLLPENTQNWEDEFQFNIFGLENKRYVNFYISRNSLIKLAIDEDFSKLINSLIVTPSGSILEISSVTDKFENVNNLFLYDDTSSVLRITCVPYYAKEHNEFEFDEESDNHNPIPDDAPEGAELDFREEPPSDNYEDEFMTLDEFFTALDGTKKEQDKEGDEISNSDSVFGSLG